MQLQHQVCYLWCLGDSQKEVVGRSDQEGWATETELVENDVTDGSPGPAACVLAPSDSSKSNFRAVVWAGGGLK